MGSKNRSVLQGWIDIQGLRQHGVVGRRAPVAPSRRLPEPRLRPPGRREASRRQSTERRVRVAGVVALEPLGEDQLRLGERAEELGVEYLVAEAGVERLD